MLRDGKARNVREGIRLEVSSGSDFGDEKFAIPTLLGKLLFLRPDSTDAAVRNQHFYLVLTLFVPWSQ
jgi:hypothetical protein